MFTAGSRFRLFAADARFASLNRNCQHKCTNSKLQALGPKHERHMTSNILNAYYIKHIIMFAAVSRFGLFTEGSRFGLLAAGLPLRLEHIFFELFVVVFRLKMAVVPPWHLNVWLHTPGWPWVARPPGWPNQDLRYIKWPTYLAEKPPHPVTGRHRAGRKAYPKYAPRRWAALWVDPYPDEEWAYVGPASWSLPLGPPAAFLPRAHARWVAPLPESLPLPHL